MTEVCTSYPGDRSKEPVGPKDPYHEPYPGYWDKKADNKADIVRILSGKYQAEKKPGI